MGAPGQSNGIKIVVAVILLLGGLVFVYAQYKSARPDIAPPAQKASGTPTDAQAKPAALGAGSFNPADITPEQRREFREEIFSQLDLTPDQRAKLDDINKKFDSNPEPAGRDAFLDRMRAQAAVLTPEQQETARVAITESLKKRVQERITTLPPAEQKAFMEKLDKRMEEGRARFEESRSAPAGQTAASTPAATQRP